MQWTITGLGHDIWQITLTGEFSVREYFLVVEEIEEKERGASNRLWDLRSVDMRRASSSDVQEIVGHVRAAYPRVGGGKTAHLVTPGLTFGLSRIVSSYTSDMPRKLRVFTDRGEAIKWLMSDEE